MRILFITTCILTLTACTSKMNPESEDVQATLYTLDPVEVPIQDGRARAYFAGGCFWCVEAVFESVRGVDEVISGYSGGHTDSPTYELSNTGITGHAEAVEVIYDPEAVDFKELVEAFFASHDPTQKNGQGPDSGSQYRAIAFYQNAAQQAEIEAHIAELNEAKYNGKIVTEIMPFQKFWVAEDDHQDYERLNPNNPYVRGVSVPRLKRFKAARPDLLKGGEE